MRKYLIGAVFGIALTIASTSYADDIKSLIGVKVQGEFPVKIDGKQLEKNAIVIDGTSYLPNRSIADALNMEISFNADLGIELKKKENKPVETMNIEPTPNAEQTNQPSPTPISTTAPMTLDELNQKINAEKNNILATELIVQVGNEGKKAEYQQTLIKQKAELAELEKQKAALSQ